MDGYLDVIDDWTVDDVVDSGPRTVLEQRSRSIGLSSSCS